MRQAHPDLDLFVRTVDPHRVQQQPAGDQLYHRADGDHISPVLPRLGDIHVDLPVDAGQGAGVFDQGQAGGFLEGVTGLCRGGDQVSETVGFQTQMHRLARRRAARLCKDFDLDAGDRAQRFGELCDHDVAVQFRAQGAVFPRDGFKLHLTDAVLGGLRPASIAVEPAFTGKGKGGRDTGMRQHDRLRLLHDRVFFRQRQVAPGQHIDDRLLGFGFDKEFHAFAVVAKEDHRGADKDKDDPRDHQRHHRIARDKGNEPPEARSTVAGLDHGGLFAEQPRCDPAAPAAHAGEQREKAGQPQKHARYRHRHQRAEHGDADKDHGKDRNDRAKDIQPVHARELRRDHGKQRLHQRQRQGDHRGDNGKE